MLELNSHTLHLWVVAFLFTQAIEMPIYGIALKKRPLLQSLLFAFGASAITHPFVWFAVPWYLFDFNLLFVLAETFAITTEAVYLKVLGMSWNEALRWAILANACSAGLGEICRYLFGWP